MPRSAHRSSKATCATSTRCGAHCASSGASAVMHFAAWLVVPDSVSDPIGYYRNNVEGALATLEAMAAEQCRRFIFSSTCAVYGEPVDTPIRETHPTAPINAYGQTKLAVEHALPHFERAYGIRSIRLRYFNAAGADPDGQLGEDHSPEIHVIPRAFEAASGGPPIEIFGEDYPTPDGTCLRDYIHVTDLADAHVRSLRRLEADGPSATLQRRHRTALVCARRARVGGTRHGQDGCQTVRGEAARRSGRALCVSRAYPQRSGLDGRGGPTSTQSSATPGDGTRPIRRAFGRHRRAR